jgi:trk system potassium uptake protein TrkH
MRFNYKIIINILGLLVMLNGAFMFLCLPFAFYYGESWRSILLSGCITVICGVLLWLLTYRNRDKELRTKDGFLIVTMGWIFMSLFGTLPFIISGSIPSFTDAFFETMSGYTTTGASILDDIESLPKGILLWRSLTQWIGGMGIIVLAVAILPLLGIGGMQLFVAEAPGIKPDKLKPRIKDTAKRLWFIYIGLTFVEIVLLNLTGMSFYDAVNHGLTTMATGGFSTRQGSIADFNPFVQYIIIVFMFLAGTSFTLTYFGLKGKLNKMWSSEEFRAYVFVVIGFSIVVAIALMVDGIYTTEGVIRNSLFQVVSVITTTGYATADFTAWTPFLTVLFFSLMFIGGSSGSTAGGVKVVRLLILMKNTILDLNRQLHPSAVVPVRYNKKAVSMEITFNIIAFIMLYITVFVTGTIIMALMGIDFMTALGSVATALANIGPGIGSVGPADSFSHIPEFGKWFLAFLMLLGRLELFTVLILFTRYYWRKY